VQFSNKSDDNASRKVMDRRYSLLESKFWDSKYEIKKPEGNKKKEKSPVQTYTENYEYDKEEYHSGVI
jgi:hypothetical protein